MKPKSVMKLFDYFYDCTAGITYCLLPKTDKAKQVHWSLLIPNCQRLLTSKMTLSHSLTPPNTAQRLEPGDRQGSSLLNYYYSAKDKGKNDIHLNLCA